MTSAEAGAYVAVLTASAGVSQAAIDLCKARIVALGTAPQAAVRRSAHAAEIPFAAAAPLDLRGAVHQIDINVLPAAGRARAILIADMDSTMIPVECIDELADFAGVKPKVAAITEAAMRGELDFEQAIDARVALLEGLPESALQACYDERVHLNPGAQALVEGMNARGARTALVSGGFTFFTERVAAAAGFQSHQANVLLSAEGRLTGAVQKPVLGQQAKADALEALCAERGVGPERVVAIGDGANDLAMVRAAGLGVAYKAKPALRAEADAALDFSDLTAVLALQGLDAPAAG